MGEMLIKKGRSACEMSQLYVCLGIYGIMLNTKCHFAATLHNLKITKHVHLCGHTTNIGLLLNPQPNLSGIRMSITYMALSYHIPNEMYRLFSRVKSYNQTVFLWSLLIMLVGCCRIWFHCQNHGEERCLQLWCGFA